MKKEKMMKKIISLLLILAFTVSVISLSSCGKSGDSGSNGTGTSGADTTGKETEGTEAPVIDVKWTIDGEGTLTISGNGQMRDFTLEEYNQSPWHSEIANIKKVIIENGVASIGEWAFQCCSSLTSISIPDSVTFIGEGAFYRCKSLKNITIPDSVIAMGEWTFKGCDDLTICCSSGSYAEKFAKAKKINVTNK